MTTAPRSSFSVAPTRRRKLRRPGVRPIAAALTLLLGLMVAGLVGAGPAAAATPVTWTLDGVAVDGNGTVTGSYSYDAETNTISNVNITYTTGGGGTTVFTDRVPNSPVSGQAFQVITDPAGDLSGRTMLQVGLLTPMSVGGPIGIGTGGFPRVTTCANADCTQFQDPTRRITGGRVVADNAAPTITSPASASVFEGRTTALDVQATDDVDSEGAGLVFTRIGGADQAKFNLNQNGILTFVTAPDFDNPDDANGDRTYEVTIRVTDSHALIADQAITLTVNNINEPPATWAFDGVTVDGGGTISGTYRYNAWTNTLSEVNITYTTGGGTTTVFTDRVPNSTVGTQVFQVVPDPVGDLTGRTTLQIGLTGHMSRGGTIGIHTGGFPRVTVCANADCTQFQNPTRRITGGQVTAGTTGPTITSPAAVTAVEDRIAAIDVEASDDIDREGAGLRYFIGFGDSALFKLDQTTGVVRFRSAPDFENPTDGNGDGVYQFSIRVLDTSGFFFDQQIQVTVTKANAVWRFDGATIQAGGRVTGTFNYDASANTMSAVNITYTAGSGVQTVFTDRIPNSTLNQRLFSVITDPNGDLTGRLVLHVNLFDPATGTLGNMGRGGTLNIGTRGFPRITTCANADCTQFQDPTRFVTGGRVITDAIAPDITSPAAVSVPEGQTGALDVQATDDVDREGAGLVYSLDGGPDAALFNLDRLGGLTFIDPPDFTNPGDADGNGTYKVAVRVSDSTGLFDRRSQVITVTSVNQAPAIDPIAAQTVDEGGTLSIPVTATDPDGDTITLTADPPPFCSLVDGGSGSGAVDCSPGPNDAGTYQFTVTATDNGSPSRAATATVDLTVTDVNRAPALGPIADRSVDENGSVPIIFNAPDPDGDAVTFTTTAPGFCELFQSPNGEGSLVCRPEFNDAGIYPITVTATDDGSPAQSATVTFNLTVADVNRPPAVNQIEDRRVDEGATISIGLSGADIDGDNVTFSVTGLPGTACLLGQDGRGNGTLVCTFGFTDSGVYPVTVTLTDDGTPPLSASTTFNLTVNDVNRAPALGPIADRSVDENGSLPIIFNAPDPDGDAVTFTTTAPGFCELFQSPNGEGSLVCRPGFNDAGIYQVEVAAEDNGTPGLGTAVQFQLTVNDVNRPPAVNEIEDRRVDEGATISIGLSGADIDGDNVTFSVTGLPEAACLLGQDGRGFGTLVCTPGYTDSGVYAVTVTLTDDGTPPLSAGTTFNLTVNEVNDPPSVDAGSDTSVTVPRAVQLSGSATDDGLPDPPSELTYAWSVANGPGPVAFENPTSPSTKVTFSTGGTFILRLTVDDGLTTGSDDVVVTVNNPLGCTILGTNSNDTLEGTDGDDVICGFNGKDRIDGGGGNDRIFGGLGNDVLVGGPDDDVIDGDQGNDVLRGEDGNDVLRGRRGNDRLHGGEGDDELFGGSGNDRLSDSSGTNLLDGGPGRDQCITPKTAAPAVDGGVVRSAVVGGSVRDGDVGPVRSGDGLRGQP